jgi:metal-responsive CopG/Arc/MetJ family transcriptional regulator
MENELMYRILITIDKDHLNMLNDLVKANDSNRSEMIRVAISHLWATQQIEASKEAQS